MGGRYGGAHAAAGDHLDDGIARMRGGLATLRTLDSKDFTTYFLGLRAETLWRAGQLEPALVAVTEALAAVERTSERFYAAELHRLKGELLRATEHDPVEATGALETALAIARGQRALALERRAVQSLEALRAR